MLGFLKKLFASSDDNNEALQQIIADGAYLIDVRTPGEFASGSVKGAVNIPLDKIGGQASKLKGKKHIVVFCRSGNRSGQAKSILNQAGFTDVTNGGTWDNVNQFV